MLEFIVFGGFSIADEIECIALLKGMLLVLVEENVLIAIFRVFHQLVEWGLFLLKELLRELRGEKSTTHNCLQDVRIGSRCCVLQRSIAY